jgi:FKBP-type peptidyl-prolyl cis-trans isomerase SlpA
MEKNESRTVSPLARVAENSEIEISFHLSLIDGTLVDETEPNERLRLTLGDGQFIKNLDDLFIGLEEGTSAKFNLIPEQAYGLANQENIQTMNKTDFPSDMKLSKGNVVTFHSPTGEEVLGTIYEIFEETVQVDFNHPLAGKALKFVFKIEKVF